MPADPLAGFTEEATPSATPTPDALAGFEEMEPPRYNSQFAKKGSWFTELNPQEETEFQQWAKKYDRRTDDLGYDMRGFWKAGKQGDPRAKMGFNPIAGEMHDPDTWKTPYSDSFSNESIYANEDAPHWVAGKLVDTKSGTPVFDDKTSRPLGYVEDDKGNPAPYNQQWHGENVPTQMRESAMKQDPNWVNGRFPAPLGDKFVGPQPPIPTAEQEALQAPAIDPVSTAVGMGTLGVVPTAIGLATEPGFRENVGKPVQNLVAKVSPKIAPYAGAAAEMAAGMGLGAGMGKGTSAGGVTMEDAGASPIPVERAQASEAEIVPQAPQPPPIPQTPDEESANIGTIMRIDGVTAGPSQAVMFDDYRDARMAFSEARQTPGYVGRSMITTKDGKFLVRVWGKLGETNQPWPDDPTEGWMPAVHVSELRPKMAMGAEKPAQRLLEGPAAAPEAPAQPQPVQPQQSGPRALPAPKETQIEPYDFKGQYQEDEFVKGVLGRYPKGNPGLEVTESEPHALRRPQYHVVYRGPDGTPVAAAVVEREGTDGLRYLNGGELVPQDLGVTGIATDKSKGLLAARAATKVAQELQNRGWARPLQGTPMTSDSRNLMERGNKAGLEQPTKALRVGDKIVQPEPTDVMHAQMFERLAPEDQAKAEPGWMVNGEFKSEPRTVPFKKPDLAETQQNLAEAPKPKTDAEYEAEAKASNQEKNRRIQSLIKAPAIKMGDKVFAGETGDLHGEIYMRHPELVTNLEKKPIESGFIDHQGNFLNQQQAAEKADVGMVDALNLWPEESGPQDASQPISAENAPSTTQPQSLEGFSESNDPAPAPEQDPFKRADVFEVPTKSALLDPETFQYKVDVDPKTGVGKSLSESSKYNPDFAGVEEMWRDADTGNLYVSHGHHRHNLALKSDAPSVRAVILDSGNSFPGAIAHNVTKEEARTRGALVNFSEGRGTVVDAANYLRNAPDMTPEKMKAMGLDLGDEKMSQAINVKNLTEPIWYQVSIGKLKPEIGSIIGKNLDKPRDQIAAYKAYEQTGNSGRPMSTATFDNFVKLIKNGGEHTETTEDLFGAHQISRSTYQEQAEILANAARELSMEKNVMGTAAKQKSRLEKGQNVINAETSQAMSKEAQDRLAVLQAYGDKPGTHSNTVLKKFAAHLAEKPKQRAAILKEAYDALVKAIDKDNPDMPAEQEDSKTGSLF